jgi:hypothetical protein
MGKLVFKIIKYKLTNLRLSAYFYTFLICKRVFLLGKLITEKVHIHYDSKDFIQ